MRSAIIPPTFALLLLLLIGGSKSKRIRRPTFGPIMGTDDNGVARTGGGPARSGPIGAALPQRHGVGGSGGGGRKILPRNYRGMLQLARLNGGTLYHQNGKFDHSRLQSEGKESEMGNEVDQARIAGGRRNPCPDDQNVHRIHTKMQAVSSKLATVLQLMQDIMSRQVQFESWLKSYRSRLGEMELKFDHILEELFSESLDISHAVQYFEKNVKALGDLREMRVRNRGILSNMNTQPKFGSRLVSSKDDFPGLKEILQKISGHLSQSNKQLTGTFSQLESMINYIAQAVSQLNQTLVGGGGGGGPSITSEQLSLVVDQFQQGTIYSVSHELNSTSNELDILLTNIGSVASVSSEWSTTVDSLVYLRQLMENTDTELKAIKKQSKKGCKVNIKGDVKKWSHLTEKRKRKENRERLEAEKNLRDE